MKKKRIIALLLAICLSFSIYPMSASAECSTKAIEAQADSDESDPVSVLTVSETDTESVTSEEEKTELTVESEAESLSEFPLDSLSYSTGSTIIRVQDVDGVSYLFLPASTDSQNLKLNCTLAEGEILYVAGDKLPDGMDASEGFDLDAVAAPNEGKYTLELTLRKELKDGSFGVLTKTASVQVMKSANFSAVYLTHGEGYEGREYVDKSKDNVIEGSMAMVTAEGKTVYDGALSQIKARGNSTFLYYPKKSYQIKLSKKTALIDGTEKGKTWVLLAGYADAVKLSDQMWKDVGNAIDAAYTAKAKRVDLYFDGEYRGSYELSEKNQLGSNRIDITDMEEAYEACNEDYGENPKICSAKNSYGNSCYYTEGLTDPSEMGGFLLEFNDKNGDDANWFKTSSGYAVNVKSPEYSSKDTMFYISEYFQEFEDAVMATDSDGNYTGYNADTGLYYYDYCDMDSLVEQYMINCISSNRDAFWHSLYFYMDTDGKLYAGPLWDMELTLGVGWNNSIPAQQDWAAQNDNKGNWGAALIQIPSFRAALKKAYQETFRDVIDALLGDSEAQVKTGLISIEKRAKLGRASVSMDSVLWPEQLKDGSPCALYPKQSYAEYYLFGKTARFRMWPKGTKYETIVQARIDWLEEHKKFLDEYFAVTDEESGEQDENDEHIHQYGPFVPICKAQHKKVCRDCGDTVVEDCVFNWKTTAITADSAGVIEGTCQECGRQFKKTVTLDVGQTFTYFNLVYEVNEKDRSVSVAKSVKKTLTCIAVPDTVSYGGVEYSVTEIKENAFQLNFRLKEVSLGQNIVSIGDRAFYGAVSLKVVTVKSRNLTNVGEKAFRASCTISATCGSNINIVYVGDFSFSQFNSMPNIKNHMIISFKDKKQHDILITKQTI